MFAHGGWVHEDLVFRGEPFDDPSVVFCGASVASDLEDGMAVGVEVGDYLGEGLFVRCGGLVLGQVSDAETGVAVFEEKEPHVSSLRPRVDQALIVHRDRCPWVCRVNAVSESCGELIALAEFACGAVNGL